MLNGRDRMNLLRFYTLLVFLHLCILPSALIAAEKLTFGVVPQQTPVKVARLWAPVVAYLAKKTNIDIHFKTEKDITAFSNSLTRSQFDIVYSNPYQYISILHPNGYRAFAKEKDRRLTGIIVVSKSKSYKSLVDLDNQIVVFPAPNAFAASMIPRAILRSRDIKIEEKYVNSHDSVYHTVAQGLYVAGGGIAATFNELAPEIKENLRILWTSDGYTPHPFSASPKVSATTLSKIAHALTAMYNDPKGKALLDNMGMHSIEIAKDENWNDVRAIEKFLR